MKNLFLLFFLVASSTAAANPVVQECAPLPSTYSFSKPMTVAEIERTQMELMPEKLKIRPDMPQVPFGFANPDWVVFKSMVRPGDKIVAFSNGSHAWNHQAGESGFALIRSGCWVQTFRLAVS